MNNLTARHVIIRLKRRPILSDRICIYTTKVSLSICILLLSFACSRGIAKDFGKAYNAAIIYAQNGQYDKAIKEFTKAIEANPNEAEIYYSRGGAYRDGGDYDSAIEDWTEVIRRARQGAKAYCKRGMLYAKIEKDELASADLQRGMKDAGQLNTDLLNNSQRLLDALLSDDKERR